MKVSQAEGASRLWKGHTIQVSTEAGGSPSAIIVHLRQCQTICPSEPTIETQVTCLLRGTGRDRYQNFHQSQTCLPIITLVLDSPTRHWAVCILFRDVYSPSSRDNLYVSRVGMYLRQKSMSSCWNPTDSQGTSRPVSWNI